MRLLSFLVLLFAPLVAHASPASPELVKTKQRIVECQREGVRLATQLFSQKSNIDLLLEQYRDATDERGRYLAFTGIQVYVAQRILNYPQDVAHYPKENEALQKAFGCHDEAEEKRRTLTDENG